MSDKPALLQLQHLQVSYGGIRAVRDVSLQVAEGELVALIGANGAGKSSTLKAVAGLLAPAALGRDTASAVLLNGEPVAGLPAHVLAARGLALVPEGRGVFGQLTVEENLAMGAYLRSADATQREAIVADRDDIYRRFPRLLERARQSAGTLSGGEQQMLAMGRALMARPRLLLLDEPSMGLSPKVAQQILELVQSVVASGVTVLLVEQNAHAALAIARRAYVMESGQITLSGDARELAANPRVQAAYLGA
jgi:branched-chain amino acid transport system ATP-binding protein